VRKSRFGILRVFALIAMMVSVSGAYALTASAAPVNTGSTSRVQAQSAEICQLLYEDGVVDGGGNFLGYRDGGLGRSFSLFLDYAYAGLTLTQAQHVVRDGGCVGKVTPAPVELDAYLYVTTEDTTGSFEGTCDGEAVSGTFVSGEAAYLGSYFDGSECDLTITAEGYYAGGASGSLMLSEGSEYLYIYGALGDPIPAPELVRTLVLVSPTGIEGTFTGTCAGDAVSGSFGADGWGDLGEFEVGVECDLTLSAPGYENGFVSGNTFANFDYAMIEGALGEPIAPELVRTLVHVTPQGVAGTVTGTCDGEDVSGTFGEDGWGDLGEFTVGVECDLTLSADGYEDGSAVGVTVANFDYAYIEGALGDLVPVTYPVTITGVTDDGGSAEGALVYIQSTDDSGAQTFFQAIPTADGTLDADNSFSTELEAGEYVVTIDAFDQGYSYNFTMFTVPTDDPVLVELNTPAAESGFVHIHNFVCDGIDKVIFGDDVDAVGKDCDPAAGTFTFYLVGDGTDDHWQVKVGADGINGIELAAGTYEVVVEANQAKTEVTVVEGEVTELVVQSPASSEQPDNGGKKDEGKKNESEVKELPKTGTGHEAGTMNTALMLSVAAAVSATAGGYVLRQKRS